jgi:hypothetical protein
MSVDAMVGKKPRGQLSAAECYKGVACAVTCRTFLDRMSAYAAHHGPIKAAATSSSSSSMSTSNQGVQMHVSSIPVYVAPTYQLAEQQQQQSVVHEVVGYIQVPMQATAQQVYTTIQVRDV